MTRVATFVRFTFFQIELELRPSDALPVSELDGTPGAHGGLAIPVPIPNTVVKQAPPMILRKRESRSSPGFSWALAASAASALFFGRRSVPFRLGRSNRLRNPQSS